jgi:uncharacterized protein (DUF1501 family)
MCKKHLKKSTSRRDILKYTLAGAGIAALGPLGRGLIRPVYGDPLPGLKRAVSIFCYGGYDGLNLVVPIGNQAYYDRRTTLAIPANEALDIGEDTAGYRLHPALTRVAELYNDGDAAIFRKVGYPNQNLSHFISQDIHSWGVRDEFEPLPIETSGWIARFADLYANTSMGAAALGVGRPLEFEGGSSNPFLAGTLANFDFNDGGHSAGEQQHRLNTIKSVLSNFSGATLPTEAKTALDQGLLLADQIQLALANYNTNSVFKDLYPATSPGRHLRDAATLIAGGFETAMFMTGFNGWDTHGNQGGVTGTQADLITRLDGAIGTFADECKAMGVWDDMVILISTEFGRRNFRNGSDGTDHGHGNMFFALGGAVTGGLYGSDITESDIADNNWLGYELDYRDIFKEAITDHFGGNGAAVFPEAQDINTNIGYV